MTTDKAKWGNKEYPLFTPEAMERCPTARYVGGVSVYLCECKQPEKCGGVRFVRQQANQAKEK